MTEFQLNCALGLYPALPAPRPTLNSLLDFWCVQARKWTNIRASNGRSSSYWINLPAATTPVSGTMAKLARHRSWMVYIRRQLLKWQIMKRLPSFDICYISEGSLCFSKLVCSTSHRIIAVQSRLPIKQSCEHKTMDASLILLWNCEKTEKCSPQNDSNRTQIFKFADLYYMHITCV